MFVFHLGYSLGLNATSHVVWPSIAITMVVLCIFVGMPEMGFDAEIIAFVLLSSLDVALSVLRVRVRSAPVDVTLLALRMNPADDSLDVALSMLRMDPTEVSVDVVLSALRMTQGTFHSMRRCRC